MNFAWTNPTFSVGWLIALVTLIVALILVVLGQLDHTAALVVVALAAIRL